MSFGPSRLNALILSLQKEAQKNDGSMLSPSLRPNIIRMPSLGTRDIKTYIEGFHVDLDFVFGEKTKRDTFAQFAEKEFTTARDQNQAVDILFTDPAGGNGLRISCLWIGKN